MAELKPKCPHYHPDTREPIIPGKSCPDYNTAKGCKFSHPFEREWDGDNNPFSGLPSARTSSSQNPSKEHTDMGSSTDTVMADASSKQPVPAQDVMEVDRRELAGIPANSRKASSSNYLEEGQADMAGNPLEDTRPINPIEKGVMAQLLEHVIYYIHQTDVSSQAQQRLSNYKALYTAYVDVAAKQSIKEYASEERYRTWIDGRRALQDTWKFKSRLKSGRLHEMIALSGEYGPALDGDDYSMSDATDVGRTEETESALVSVLRKRKERLRRGFVGEQLVELRILLETVQKLVEATKSSIESTTLKPMIALPTPVPALGHGAPVLCDIEIGEGTSPRQASISGAVAYPSTRLPRSFLDRIEEIEARIEAAEAWATSDVVNDEFRAHINEMLTTYLKGLEASREDGISIAESLATPKQEYLEVKSTCYELSHMVKPLPPFPDDVAEQYQLLKDGFDRLQTMSTNLDRTLKDIESRQPTSDLPAATRSKLVSQMKDEIISQISNNANIAPPQQLSLDVTKLDRQLVESRNEWLAQYDQLKEEGLRLISPLVERTKKQKSLLGLGVETPQGGEAASRPAEGSSILMGMG